MELNGFKSVGIKEINAKCDKYGRSAKKVFEYVFSAEAAVTGYNKLYIGAVKGRANLIWAEIAVE